MKAKLIITTLSLSFFFVANVASAQIPYVGQLQYGVKAGLNTAWISSEDEAEEESPRLGIGAGIAARYWITPSLAVQAEAQYSQKGEQCGDDCTIQLDYIEIPVLARYAIPLSPLMTAGIYAGPSIGVPINSKLKIEGVSDDIEDVSTDFGLNVGVDIGSGPFYVDGRFNFGLTNIQRGDDLPEVIDSKNQHVQFTFGYWF